MLTRKSKSERERLRIEEAEYQRRVRDGGAMRAAGDVQLGEGTLISEPTDEAPCRLHPQWSPDRWLEVQPRRSAEECPYCQRARLQRRQPDPTASEPIILENPRSRSPFDFGQDSERVAKAIEKYDERQRTRPGHAVPGSPEEARALEMIADRRAEERDGERRKSGRGGVFLFSRIENGDLIDYYDRRRSLKERPQLVRVGP
jgi:hypothetical protein